MTRGLFVFIEVLRMRALLNPLWGNSGFRNLWIAGSISNLGTTLGAVYLTALVYLDASIGQMAVLTAAARGGPPLVGAGVPGAGFFAALLFSLPLAFFTRGIGEPRTSPPPPRRSMASEAFEGFRSVAPHPLLRAVLAMVASYSFFSG